MKKSNSRHRKYLDVRQKAYQESFTKTTAHMLLSQYGLSALEEVDKPRVFTLPGTSFIFESIVDSVVNASGGEMVGIEGDPEVYRTARKKAKAMDLSLKLEHTHDLDYWTDKPVNPFDLIWLDYCGPWCKAKYASVEQIVHRGWLNYRPGHNPMLGLTLMEGLDMASFQDFLMAAGPGGWKQRNSVIRIGGVAKWVNAIANTAGQSADLKVIYRYRDRVRARRARSMLLFIFEMHSKVRQFDLWSAVGLDLIQSAAKDFLKPKL